MIKGLLAIAVLYAAWKLIQLADIWSELGKLMNKILKGKNNLPPDDKE